MREWPSFLKPIVQFFVPQRWRLIQYENEAKRIIGEELRRRQREKGVYKDSLQWFQDRKNKTKVNFDLAEAQLAMGNGAIHTTSMALTRALFDLCVHYECVQPLRDEVVRVLAEDGGWKKTTLYKMKLMDSFLKESQRLNPVHFSKHLLPVLVMHG